MKKFLFAFFTLFLTACDRSETETQPTHTAMPVTVIMPKMDNIKSTLMLHGTLAAEKSISVSTPLQGLQILSVNAEVGDRVKKGQVLAYLESNNVQSQLQQNNAQLARAKANLVSQQATLKEAESLMKRYRQLIKSDSVSHQEVDSQQAKVSTAQAAVNAAKAEIEQIQAQLADSRHQRNKAEIIVPVNGVIIKRNAERGSLTDSNALFIIAQQGKMELQAVANAAEIAKLTRGQVVQMMATNHEPMTGNIRQLPQEIDSSTRQGIVKISLDETVSLPIGSYAKAKIVFQNDEQKMTLPFSAVAFANDGSASVMTVSIEGVAMRKSVKIGEQFAGKVAILDGILNDELVVKQAAAFIDEGDVVSPQLEGVE